MVKPNDRCRPAGQAWPRQAGNLVLSSLCLVPALWCLAGCQSLKQPAAVSSVAVSDSQDSRKMTHREAADVQFALGRALEKAGQTEQAAVAYQDAVKLDPRRADAYVRLGVLADCQGKGKDAADDYRMALKIKPGDPDIYCDMGYSCYLRHRWPDAEMNFRQALAIAPDHRRAQINLGLVLVRTDRVSDALAAFDAAKCDPADAQVNVAFALALNGEWQEARGYYERAVAMKPSSEAAKAGLHEVQTVMANLRRTQPAVSSGGSVIQLTNAAGQAPAELSFIADAPHPD